MKYAYLSNDLFSFIEGRLGDVLALRAGALEEVILRCNSIKAGMIAEDERDEKRLGGRAALNLGHTIGQAIEGLANYRLRHGEAVLLGLLRELRLALNLGILERSDFGRLDALVRRIPLPRPKALPTVRRIGRSIFAHRERARFVLPRGIGEVVSVDVEKNDFLKCVSE